MDGIADGWTDGWTYGRWYGSIDGLTDGRKAETNLILVLDRRLSINNEETLKPCFDSLSSESPRMIKELFLHQRPIK